MLHATGILHPTNIGLYYILLLHHIYLVYYILLLYTVLLYPTAIYSTTISYCYIQYTTTATTTAFKLKLEDTKV